MPKDERAPSLGDQRRSLTLGTRVGGLSKESRLASDATRKLSVMVTHREDALDIGDPETEASVNVIFDVPGPIVAPDYHGVQAGRWSKKDRHQIMHVAVPAADLTPAELPTFLASSLLLALDEAHSAMSRRKERYPLDRATAIATAIASDVASEFASEPAANAVRATTQDGRSVLLPTLDRIKAMVETMPRMGGFIVLQRDNPDVYIQTAFSDGDIVLEYRDGDPQRHFQAYPVSQDEAAQALWEWSSGSAAFHGRHTWQRLKGQPTSS